jgi:hypothetical protein
MRRRDRSASCDAAADKGPTVAVSTRWFSFLGHAAIVGVDMAVNSSSRL